MKVTLEFEHMEELHASRVMVSGYMYDTEAALLQAIGEGRATQAREIAQEFWRAVRTWFALNRAVVVQEPHEEAITPYDPYTVKDYANLTVKTLKQLTTDRGLGLKNLRDYKRFELIRELEAQDRYLRNL